MNEVDKAAWSLAKKVYPVTEKEKTCINEQGLRCIKRSHIKKAIISAINKELYEQEAAEAVLDSTEQQTEPNY